MIYKKLVHGPGDELLQSERECHFFALCQKNTFRFLKKILAMAVRGVMIINITTSGYNHYIISKLSILIPQKNLFHTINISY